MVESPSRRGSRRSWPYSEERRGFKHQALGLQHPGVSPPERLRLRPSAIENHDALDPGQRAILIGKRDAFLVEDDEFSVLRQFAAFRRTEMQYRPLGGIGWPTKRLGETWP